MRFVFRLEAPLRLARHAEDEAKRALGAAIGRLEEGRRKLALLGEELEAETQAQRAPRSGTIWAQGQSLFLEWTRAQRGRIAAARQDVSEAEKGVAAAREELLVKRRSVQVLERLKERRQAQWKLERARKELAEGSDVAARRWARTHR